jgi:hypothetical protein
MKWTAIVLPLLLLMHYVVAAQPAAVATSVQDTTQQVRKLSLRKANQLADSTIANLQAIPARYLNTITGKIDSYRSRVSKKTLTTLRKLSRWETKIKNTLTKLHPETAQALFAEGQVTFNSLLQQLEKGEALALQYQTQYNQYRDELTTSLQYLNQQKALLNDNVAKQVACAREKAAAINAFADSSEALQQFIQERKQQLIKTAFAHMGNSRYLRGLNKDAFYALETFKNYKEIFSDETKTLQLVKDVLHRVPGFAAFVKRNSMLAGLFDVPDGGMQLQPGMQTIASVQQIMQERISAMGPNAKSIVSQNLEAAQAQLDSYKNKLLNGIEQNGEAGLPDFTPNMEKTKSFAQRIEKNFNLQFTRSNALLPTAAELALGAGYKFSSKVIAGFALSYRLGIGSIANIKFTHEGFGIRSFLDWKVPSLVKADKNGFFVSAGFEMNYIPQPISIVTPPIYKLDDSPWQQSALLGIAKKLNIQRGKFKSVKFQLLYDFLASKYIPARQHWLFRIGYGF